MDAKPIEFPTFQHEWRLGEYRTIGSKSMRPPKDRCLPITLVFLVLCFRSSFLFKKAS